MAINPVKLTTDFYRVGGVGGGGGGGGGGGVGGF